MVICCRIRRRTAGANQFGATGGESRATPDKRRLSCIPNPAWPARQFLFFCMLAPDSIHEFIEAPANLGGGAQFLLKLYRRLELAVAIGHILITLFRMGWAGLRRQDLGRISIVRRERTTTGDTGTATARVSKRPTHRSVACLRAR